ncbi:hypothetical protein GALMADRAFT_145206 [Galerina marginata CBS 339.88]|uniref:Uncharacterized protein n=1 Tax=Galerina marginata (strain CBS 339.88) TaxID=685588 RepID=A0A067SQ32_GALM3|nr:hypothetical protein GALMADRAFT_145206 [Galerina marginata CBS 339.88]
MSIVSQRLVLEVNAHIAAWHKGMYCLNGTTGTDNQNTNDAVQPLYQFNKSDWWFHHYNLCDQFPPAPGDFLDLPANGQFTVELATNRAFTTLSNNGTKVALYGDGLDHPNLGDGVEGTTGNNTCITSPNIHTRNESMASGTVFAISYVSDLKEVTESNLVVFSVLYNTPWQRLATYSVPNLPACPEPGGCICSWGWVPNGCGVANMYMLPYRCRVTGQTGASAVAPGKAPVWCEDDPTKCVGGAKQMVFWHQLEGNNVVVSGSDLAGNPKSPTYNLKMGFSNGAQMDIFLDSGPAETTSIDLAAPATTLTSITPLPVQT